MAKLLKDYEMQAAAGGALEEGMEDEYYDQVMELYEIYKRLSPEEREQVKQKYGKELEKLKKKKKK